MDRDQVVTETIECLAALADEHEVWETAEGIASPAEITVDNPLTSVAERQIRLEHSARSWQSAVVMQWADRALRRHSSRLSGGH